MLKQGYDASKRGNIFASIAAFWSIVSFKLKKLFANYHALSKVFVE